VAEEVSVVVVAVVDEEVTVIETALRSAGGVSARSTIDSGDRIRTGRAERSTERGPYLSSACPFPAK
jgi:hypothetical protein